MDLTFFIIYIKLRKLDRRKSIYYILLNLIIVT